VRSERHLQRAHSRPWRPTVPGTQRGHKYSGSAAVCVCRECFCVSSVRKACTTSLVNIKKKHIKKAFSIKTSYIRKKKKSFASSLTVSPPK